MTKEEFEDIIKPLYLMSGKDCQFMRSALLGNFDKWNEAKQCNTSDVSGRFSSLEECENEAISFTKDKMKVVGGLLSEDYKIGYKEGVEHYLASKNDL